MKNVYNKRTSVVFSVEANGNNLGRRHKGLPYLLIFTDLSTHYFIIPMDRREYIPSTLIISYRQLKQALVPRV